MKIVFHSNFMNHHQNPFVSHLHTLGCDLVFVSYVKLPKERKDMGYSTEQHFGRHIPYSTETAEEVRRITLDADAVIFGCKPDRLFEERAMSGKLTFNYSERLFKRGEWQKWMPSNVQRLRTRYMADAKHVPYLLAAGDYAVKDYRYLGYPANRILKWGYFPPLTDLPFDMIMKSKKVHSIVWVARFIDWKHPEYVVELGKYLKKKGYSFHIKMIGTGKLWEKTQKEIVRNGLAAYIELTGALSPEQVRREFESSQIAILTSDRREGWGAVINEAMNSGCATVASQYIGSSTYLIQNGYNGMTYSNKRQLFRQVEQLLQNNSQCQEMGTAAYHTITQLWNYRIAAERFCTFIKDTTKRYDNGPLSIGVER